MITLTQILLLLALAFTVASAVGRLPLWPAVLVLIMAQLLAVFPR